MEQGRFTLDFGLQEGIDGITDGQTWNGWATPLFTYESALEIVDKLTAEYETLKQRESDEGIGGYLPESDEFWFRDTGYTGEPIEELTFGKPYEFEGTKYYPFGAGSWCWIQVGKTFEDEEVRS